MTPCVLHAPPITSSFAGHLYNIRYLFSAERKRLDEARACLLLTTGQQLITSYWSLRWVLEQVFELWGVGGNGGWLSEGYEIGWSHGMWGLQLTKGCWKLYLPPVALTTPFASGGIDLSCMQGKIGEYYKGDRISFISLNIPKTHGCSALRRACWILHSGRQSFCFVGIIRAIGTTAPVFRGARNRPTWVFIIKALLSENNIYHISIIIDELERCGSKRSWPNLRYYIGIWLEGLRKTTDIPSELSYVCL
jgi:hypothetical protein